MADNFPSPRTFRELGRVKPGTITVDGTKIQTNPIHLKAMSYARMQTTEA